MNSSTKFVKWIIPVPGVQVLERGLYGHIVKWINWSWMHESHVHEALHQIVKFIAPVSGVQTLGRGVSLIYNVHVYCVYLKTECCKEKKRRKSVFLCNTQFSGLNAKKHRSQLKIFKIYIFFKFVCLELLIYMFLNLWQSLKV